MIKYIESEFERLASNIIELKDLATKIKKVANI